jgi:hypothetical protein
VNKKAIAILGAIFILIVATLGFLIYSRSKSDDSSETPTITDPIVEETPVEDPSDPEKPAGSAVRLTDDPVISPILFYQGNGISYFNSQGQLFQTDLLIDSSSVVLSNKRERSIELKSNISRILWPLAGRGFMAEFNSSSKPSWSYYDADKASYMDIPTQVYSLDWMPSGDKIMFIWVDGNGKATLNLSNPDTTGYQLLTDLYEPDNVIHVSPDGNNVLFYRKQTSDNTKNTINMVTADGKTFTSVVKDGYNTGVLWAPDSKKFLFTKRDPGTQKFGLWVADIITGDIKNLNLYTSQTKAAWTKDSQYVYAGVPVSGNASQGALTEDTIHKITISSGQSEQFDPGIAVDARDLFLSSSEEALFFRNAQDNSLYYISVR